MRTTTNCVRAFTEKVKTNRTFLIPEEGYIDGERTNRGNKLKVGAEFVHRDRVDGFNNDVEAIEEITYNGVQRAVYKRKREDDDDQEDQSHQSDNDDPYAEVDIYEALRPISHPSEVSSRETISSTYTSKILRHFANQSIEIIEKEQDTVMKLSSILDFFLGEDEKELLEAGLDLPDYDYNPVQTQQEDNADVDMDKRVTRNSTVQEADPFFALPQLIFDPNQGLPPQIAEEARQLSQLALQRTEEFIRSLRNVRNGLVRSQCIKEKIFEWGREMNGDPDESDVYVAEKEAAAKAAIAEKEARAALDPAASSESSSAKDTPQPPARRGRGRRAAQ